MTPVHRTTALVPAVVVLLAGLLGPDTSSACTDCVTHATAARVLPFEDGLEGEAISVAEAGRRGLTIVDLSDGFRPRVLADDPALGPAGVLPYGAIHDALAAERAGQGPEQRRARADRYYELYGIFPNLRVLRERALDEERHLCHAAVDDRALAAIDAEIRAGPDPAAERARARSVVALRRALEQARTERGIASIEALGSEDAYAARVARLARLAPRVDAITAAQRHLRCDRLLPERATEGVIDAATVEALRLYQRKHMIAGRGSIDPDTRWALLADSRELDFRSLLRALRERVVDATGLIEDGSARGEWGTVVGRELDTPGLRVVSRYAPLPGGAPDLVSAATDAAARALGWTDPGRAAAWLDIHRATGELRVALPLPPPPPYHSEHMELWAVIDRGDVWYDYPYTAGGRRRPQPIEVRPTLVLYASAGDREVPLVRYATTIGGWKPERMPGGQLVLRYKPSEPGAAVWRDIVASPTWQPPPSTPDADLVHRVPGAGWEANRDLLGPSYASAYGLVAVVHHRVDGRVLRDRGVRSHGSGAYRTILRGESHGCHRLFNHLALRLASFLLRHREHLALGVQRTRYTRTVRAHGTSDTVRIDTRGLMYELTPPVPVEVTEGRIRGRLRTPPDRPMPIPGRARPAA